MYAKFDIPINIKSSSTDYYYYYISHYSKFASEGNAQTDILITSDYLIARLTDRFGYFTNAYSWWGYAYTAPRYYYNRVLHYEYYVYTPETYSRQTYELIPPYYAYTPEVAYTKLQYSYNELG